MHPDKTRDDNAALETSISASYLASLHRAPVAEFATDAEARAHRAAVANYKAPSPKELCDATATLMSEHGLTLEDASSRLYAFTARGLPLADAMDMGNLTPPVSGSVLGMQKIPAKTIADVTDADGNSLLRNPPAPQNRTEIGVKQVGKVSVVLNKATMKYAVSFPAIGDADLKHLVGVLRDAGYEV